MAEKSVRILGCRGVPAAHGGFETFAESLALYLVGRGWKVVVYCQNEVGSSHVDVWRGVERVHIAVANAGSRGTVDFDWQATMHAAEHNDLCLVLGYNTAIFCALLRFKRVPNVINMDGIEWARAKWSGAAKAWLWFNERAACWLGDHLVADHPQIKAHLSPRVDSGRITTITYGADSLVASPEGPVRALGLEPGRYLTVVARTEPENSLLEIVGGFSASSRGIRLAVVGGFDAGNAYHRAVRAAATDEVIFLGEIYERQVLQALRFHCAAYVHGHQVGGTNPSLVEALGAGNAVIAHDNRFNRWVAGSGARYFSDQKSFAESIDLLLRAPEELPAMQRASRDRFLQEFTWDKVLPKYEALLEAFQGR